MNGSSAGNVNFILGLQLLEQEHPADAFLAEEIKQRRLKVESLQVAPLRDDLHPCSKSPFDQNLCKL
ncbi:MAG: hypothetical protein DME24_19865 [Verrucomicrobia bacterium]|nr:MAG: hypothetical protein DME24_19865 [Verrucomicrobiota bacterium]